KKTSCFVIQIKNPQLHNLTTLQLHNFTTSQLHDSTTPRLHNLTTSQLYNFTTLQLHDFTTWPLNLIKLYRNSITFRPCVLPIFVQNEKENGYERRTKTYSRAAGTSIGNKRPRNRNHDDGDKRQYDQPRA